jgi:hypothetical protein
MKKNRIGATSANSTEVVPLREVKRVNLRRLKCKFFIECWLGGMNLGGTKARNYSVMMVGIERAMFSNAVCRLLPVMA